MKRILLSILVVITILVPRPGRAEHLRDLATVVGARDNQLVGYGIVTGLSQTGDDMTVPFAQQTMMSMLRRLGIQVTPQQMMMRNVAAVLVTATLPPFAKQGSKIDVTVSSIGNARSLAGGVLIQTVLKGADQHAYATAQGSLVVGSFSAQGANGSHIQQGSTLATGRIPDGALVERELHAQIIGSDNTLRLELRTPGFTVASRVAEAINKKFPQSASADDAAQVTVKIPETYRGRTVDLVAALEDVDVTPVRAARVVINERTGTIVAGGDVRLSPSAIVHGGLTIVVREQQQASQPGPLSNGNTVVTQNSDVEAKEGNNTVHFVPAQASLADVASALGALGLSPRELASVLQALRNAGALEAEVVVQ